MCVCVCVCVCVFVFVANVREKIKFFCRVCSIAVVTIDLSCACMYSSSQPHNEFVNFFMKLSLA